ncbi:hypothetical protein BurMR1_1833 [Burkholderia sp. MR1]|nr:hypothetical protein BurMR1_1833 [Burkholderia sp. MR1]
MVEADALLAQRAFFSFKYPKFLVGIGYSRIGALGSFPTGDVDNYGLAKNGQ